MPGKRVVGRPFKKGQSGNPAGAKPLPLEVREFRKAAKAEIIEEFKYLWTMKESELEEILDPENDVPMIRKAIAKQLLSGSLEEVLNRVIGKPKEEIELNGRMNVHSQIVAIIAEVEGKLNRENNEEPFPEIGEEESEDQEGGQSP